MSVSKSAVSSMTYFLLQASRYVAFYGKSIEDLYNGCDNCAYHGCFMTPVLEELECFIHNLNESPSEASELTWISEEVKKELTEGTYLIDPTEGIYASMAQIRHTGQRFMMALEQLLDHLGADLTVKKLFTESAVQIWKGDV